MPPAGTEFHHALNALRFLTRLPVPAGGIGDWSLARAARWFPLAGLVVGVLAGAAWWLASAIGLPPLAAAGLALTVQALLTGGLHEDGLADLADGLGSGAGRARALEIMRDSRIGAHGALALGLSLLLRTAALAALAPAAGLAALAIANILSRAAISLSLGTLPYARPAGLAQDGRDHDPRALALTVGLACVAALLLGGLTGVLAIAAAAIGWAAISWRLVRSLGGHTGDGLGATEQVVQAAVLLVLAAAWG
ncbi:adenosylcobinamide-GDP ribazoletransferase [Rhodobacteraceae bacterium 2CG4]|uniref:Adenosylcobinamide-GDP ribazoletransferase n=1 Tax=Halovulum marinum TaxID=2662447 RepID=A0A6L5YVP4_9RHOB|nr:adenosylcobinamide-GDP ribazoletransferase [Halovulum marinum]MSU88371.1 adenosylcobinamide-GDP ribazoletransferase [Halovulum marinum]